MAAAAEPRPAEGESSTTYLELFLQRQSAGNVNDDDGYAPSSGRRQQLPEGAQQQCGGSIDGELEDKSLDVDHGGSAPVARRFSRLPAPRSPPRRPPPATHASWSGRLDSSTLLESGEEDRRVPTYARRQGANGPTCPRSEQDPRIREEVTVDRAERHQRWAEPQATTTTIEPRATATAATAVKSGKIQSGIPYKNRTGGPPPTATAKTKKESTDVHQATVDSKRAYLQSRRFNAAAAATDNATSAGQWEKTSAAMSARESSTLFWEESEAMEAMSAIGCDHQQGVDGDIETERRETLGRSARRPKISCSATEFPHRGKAISGRHGGRSAGIVRDDGQQQPGSATQTRGRSVSGPIGGRRHSPDDRFGSRPLAYSAGRAEGHSRHDLHCRSGSPGAASRATHAGSRGGMVAEQQHRARNETGSLVGRGIITAAGGGSGFAASVVAQSDTKSGITGLIRRDGGCFGLGGGRGAARQSSTNTGGGRGVKMRTHAPFASPDLSLGQAMRTMGGLVAGDGTKVSAVSIAFFF